VLTIITPRGRFYVLTIITYGLPVPAPPYVLTIITGCADHHHGILFFAPAPAGGVDEGLVIPFLEVSGWRMRAVRKFGKAIVRGNAVTIAAEEALAGLAQKPIVLVFGKPADNGLRGCADCLCGVAAG